MTTRVAALLLLCCAPVSAAPRARKATPPKTTRPSPKDAPAVQDPSPKISNDSRGRQGQPLAPLDDLNVAIGLAAGGFTGGGFNRGPSAAATITWTPHFAARRLALDVEVGWRMAGFTSPVEGFGQVRSTLHAFPVTPVVRFTLVRSRIVLFDVRGGIGALFLLHHLTSDFDRTATRFAPGWEVFAGSQVRVPISGFEVVLDGRVALGEAHVPLLLGRATGLQGMLGVRYPLP